MTTSIQPEASREARMQKPLIADEIMAAADVSHTQPDQPASRVDHPAALTIPNPLMLIERAVDQGFDPAQLQALVELHERWRAARASEEFAKAMNLCQIEMPLIVRESRNDQTNSLYARLENINVVAKPIYTRHGFALSFAEADSAVPGFKRIICDVRHNAGHCAQYHLDLPIDGVGPKGNPIGGMNAVQGCISTGTYGQRVLTCRIFNITVADTDLDGRPAARENSAPHPQAPQVDPRGQRWPKPTPKPKEVTADQVTFLVGEWKHAYQGETVEQWAQFVAKKTGRIFDVKKSTNWTVFDLEAIRTALNIPTEEQLNAAGAK